MRLFYDFFCIGLVLLTAWRRLILWLVVMALGVLLVRVVFAFSEPSVGCESSIECAEVERG